MVTIVLCDDEVESLQRTEAEIERIKEAIEKLDIFYK